MSRVFVAEETSLGRKVVVKVLPPELAAAVNLERFRREIQLAAKLQHPHIVPVLAAGVSEGLPYYTMPFIEGESLRAKLSRGGELPIHDAVRILRDTLSALSYAHEHGVVHLAVSFLARRSHRRVVNLQLRQDRSIVELEVLDDEVALGSLRRRGRRCRSWWWRIRRIERWRWRDWSGGRGSIPKRRSISRWTMCWSIRCAGALPRGPAFG